MITEKSFDELVGTFKVEIDGKTLYLSKYEYEVLKLLSKLEENTRK